MARREHGLAGDRVESWRPRGGPAWRFARGLAFAVVVSVLLVACGGGGTEGGAGNGAAPPLSPAPPPVAQPDPPPGGTTDPAAPPVIVVDRAEPLSGTVTLSLNPAVTGTVTWFVDLAQAGSGATLAWNTKGVGNGSHLLVARVQPGAGAAAYEVRRTVSVSNSSITASAVVSGTTGTIAVDAVAASPFGITRVSATFDGVPAGSLAAPNACASRFGCTAFDAYRFTVDAAVAGSGAHTMVITATDGSGATQSVSVPVPIANPPVLAVQGPADGAFVHGTLQVAGTVASDRGGAVTVTARLGDLPFLQTTSSPFAASVDIGGLAPGAYTLTVTAADSGNLTRQVQRKVIVTSTAALAHSPAFAMPAGAQLLAAQGSLVLHGAAEGQVRLRDLASGSEVLLAGTATIQYLRGWQLSGGRVYGYGKGADCVNYCIYEWGADGTVRNLSTPNPFSQATNIGGGWAADQHPVARGAHVVWVNDKAADTGVATSATGRYTVHDAQARTYTRVGVPAGVAYLGNWNYDFAVDAGVVHFWFWGQTGGEGMASTFDVFRWRSDTGATTRVTAGGARHVYTQTDGVRAAWQQSPVGGNADDSFTLLSQPLAGGSTTTWSTSATTFRLRDGVLAWVERGTGGAQALKAATATQVHTLSSLAGSSLLDVGAGRVAYVEQGRLHVFDSATGQARLRAETALGGPVFLVDGFVVFAVDALVYRVPL